MSLTLNSLICLLCLLLLIASASSDSQGQNLANEVKELRQIVQQLQARIEQLEDSSKSHLPESAEDDKMAPNTVKTFWKNGLRMESGDGALKLKIGGRINSDWYTGEVENGDSPTGTRFRRARIRAQGILQKHYIFDWQYDFAGDGAAKWRNLYIGYTGMDWATIRVGQFKEPFGLEQLTRADHIAFMERAPLDLLVPARETGLMLNHEILDKRTTWAVGLFQNTNEFGDGEDEDAEDGDWDLTGRLTTLAWYQDEGRRLLHLGLGYSHREWDDDPFRVRSRGSFRRGDHLVDTGAYEVDDLDLFGAETALVLGPLSLQSEYVLADVNPTHHGSQDINGFYAEMSYFLTGEYRPYKSGAFTRLNPKRNLDRDGGWGAWEIAFRYGQLNLDETPVSGAMGGELDDFVVGLNWYLNPNVRVMSNYVHSESNDSLQHKREADIFQVRFEHSF